MKAFQVGVKGSDRLDATIFARTAGAAKYKRLRELREPWPDITFTNLTCKSLGDIPEPATPQEIAQAQADDFNATHPVGTFLRYWSGIKKGEPTGVAPIKHVATVVGGTAVTWMQGVSSCHALTHVETADRALALGDAQCS